MRTLASIQTIKSLSPIKDADRIELASMNGVEWKCVVLKGAHKAGDFVVYIEIDSLLPRAPWSEFLFKPEDARTLYRVRTVKLRGQLSQGIVFSVNTLDFSCQTNLHYDNLVEGADVTSLLGIVKYEPPVPACLSGICKGNFPSYVPKTDEPRVQAHPGVLREIAGKEVHISVKMDGNSGTFLMHEGHFSVCSRNMMLTESETNTFWKVAKLYQLEEKLSLEAYSHLAIQGEVCGPGIQKNRLNLKEHDLFVFSIFDTITGQYLGWEDFIRTVQALRLKNVPLLYKGVFEPWWGVGHLLEMAEGSYEGTSNQREGIVIRPLVEYMSTTLKGRLSFKTINNLYLLKGED